MKKILLTMLLIGTMKCSASGEIFGYDAGQETYFGSKQNQESLILLNVIKFLITPISFAKADDLITSVASAKKEIEKIVKSDDYNDQDEETSEEKAKKIARLLLENHNIAIQVIIMLKNDEIMLKKIEGIFQEEISKIQATSGAEFAQANAEEARKAAEAEAKANAEEERRKTAKAQEEAMIVAAAAAKAEEYTVQHINLNTWQSNNEIPAADVIACYTIKTAKNFVRLVAHKGRIRQPQPNTVYFECDPKVIAMGMIQERWFAPLFEGLANLEFILESTKPNEKVSFKDSLRTKTVRRSCTIHAFEAKLDREPKDKMKVWLEMGQLVTESPEWHAAQFDITTGALNITCNTTGYNSQKGLAKLVNRIFREIT